MCIYLKPVWWDRDIDREGRVIRSDVRKAAQDIWGSACGLTKSLLGDTTEAAEIMEVCVARISQYLNSRNEQPFTQNTNALLMVAFRNSLLNRAAKLRREEPISESETLESGAAWGSIEAIEIQLDLGKLVSRLSKRSRTILVLRDAGYDWNEIASLLRVTVSVAKNSFRRELREVQLQLARRDRRSTQRE